MARGRVCFFFFSIVANFYSFVFPVCFHFFFFFFLFFFVRLNKASSTSLEHHMYRLLRRIEPVKRGEGGERSNIVKVN